MCSIMISWFLLVPVLVPVLVSLLSFVRKRVLFPTLACGFFVFSAAPLLPSVRPPAPSLTHSL